MIKISILIASLVLIFTSVAYSYPYTPFENTISANDKYYSKLRTWCLSGYDSALSDVSIENENGIIIPFRSAIPQSKKIKRISPSSDLSWIAKLNKTKVWLFQPKVTDRLYINYGTTKVTIYQEPCEG